MGISSSRRRRRREQRMDSDSDPAEIHVNAESTTTNEEVEGTDLVTLLRFLVRSGNVSLVSRNGRSDDDDDDEEYGMYDEYIPTPPDSPEGVSNPVESEELKTSGLHQTISQASGQSKQCLDVSTATKLNSKKKSVSKFLQMREVGMRRTHCFSPGEKRIITSSYLPNTVEVKEHLSHKAFCGIYSNSGDIFLSACQDRTLRVYDTSMGQFRKFKSISARNVGWSVLDTAFSPDGNYLIYSSWSEFIHIVNIYGDSETHTALHLCPESEQSFCIFSVTFSDDNTEIMGGSNDGHIYVFDRERNERTLRIDAHDDDVNTVRFADTSSNILTSGGDDGLIKVWDRRTLREEAPEPVGILAGHTDGATYIDTKGDGRYLISNSKDQTVKLWDMRKFSSESAQTATRDAVANQHWDYRWQQPNRFQRKFKKILGDSSLMTYRGHSILHTLVRCRFSPLFSTGQRYIYTGCASGAVVIYDLLTGEVISRLREHRSCVRDVSWHPYENNIVSSSWDGRLGMWTYTDPNVSDAEFMDESDSGNDGSDSEDKKTPRRSKRLQTKSRFGSMFHNLRQIIMD